jgi:hypothetical protein
MKSKKKPMGAFKEWLMMLGTPTHRRKREYCEWRVASWDAGNRTVRWFYSRNREKQKQVILGARNMRASMDKDRNRKVGKGVRKRPPAYTEWLKGHGILGNEPAIRKLCEETFIRWVQEEWVDRDGATSDIVDGMMLERVYLDRKDYNKAIYLVTQVKESYCSRAWTDWRADAPVTENLIIAFYPWLAANKSMPLAEKAHALGAALERHGDRKRGHFMAHAARKEAEAKEEVRRRLWEARMELEAAK